MTKKKTKMIFTSMKINTHVVNNKDMSPKWVSTPAGVVLPKLGFLIAYYILG